MEEVYAQSLDAKSINHDYFFHTLSPLEYVSIPYRNTLHNGDETVWNHVGEIDLLVPLNGVLALSTNPAPGFVGLLGL